MMAAPNADERIDELEAKHETTKAELKAVEAFEETVVNAESIADTQLSMLFHEARTNSKQHWKSVSAFCNIEDGDVIVDSVSKIQDGHWTPETRNKYDFIVSVGVRPFMDTRDFKRSIEAELSQVKRGMTDTLCSIENSIKRLKRGQPN